jgi:hypothetical protein
LWYGEERDEIQARDFTKDLGQPDDVLELTAQFKGLSLAEYKKEIGESKRAAALKELDERFGIAKEKSETEAVKQQALDRYRAMADQLFTKSPIPVDGASLVFNKPEIKD